MNDYRPAQPSEAEVAWYLNDYRPSPRLVPPDLWAKVGPFAVAYVLAAAPAYSLEAKYLISPLAQYAAWSFARGVAIDNVTELFTRALIERWIGAIEVSDASRSNYRDALHRIAAANNPRFRRRAAQFSRPPVERPYTPRDLTALWNWAAFQRGIRSVHARLLLAIGLGSGLLIKDFRLVRVRHVDDTPDGLLITTLGQHSRTIPVLDIYAPAIRAVARDADPNTHLFWPSSTSRDRNLVTSFLDDCRTTDAPRLSLQRLRANWVVWHFDHGTPIGPLAEAAGVQAITIARYAEFVNELDPATARRLLHGRAQ